ncbi:MAG: hypothetical protein [Siphoviridae sp. ctjeG17]|nr:MAG: hypothetical protein [Siphoviridae sp. ctjeG17]
MTGFIESLFVPNLSASTFIGIALIVLFIILAIIDFILVVPPFKGAVTRFGLYILYLGLFMLFVPSFLSDLFSTTESTLIIFGAATLGFLIYFLYFRKGGKK